MKRLCALLSGVLCLLTLAGCGGNEETPSGDMSAPAGDRKIGLGSVNTLAMDGTDKNRVKVTVAAVIVGKDGRIEECRLDELDFTVALAGGKPQAVADLSTKGEKGDSYMPTAEETGTDAAQSESWEDQVEDFCDFVEGKTHREITGLATPDGKSEQIPGCNLVITDFIQAIDRALMAAMTRNIGADDDLELALTATPADTTAEDRVQYDVEMAAVALDEQDRITGCMTDTLQAKLTMEQGAFTTVSGGVETKRQMGDGYKMKEASSIKREWYEQADAFDTYVRGKTATQLTGLTLGADGKTDAITGCTVAVSGMLRNTIKAAQKD